MPCWQRLREMHELAVGRALLKQVTSIMLERQAATVTGITLKIGPLSGIEPALLRAAYDQLRRETGAERAELHMIEVPVRIRCEACDIEMEAASNRLVCSRCGSTHTALVSGDEMLIESVDLVFQGNCID